MTWRELFRRAWLVLRLRRKWFVLCRVCSVPLLAAEITIQSRCEDCEELERLESARAEREWRRVCEGAHWTGPTVGELHALQNDHTQVQRQLALLMNAKPGQPIYLAPGLGIARSAIGYAIGQDPPCGPFS